ncbi:MAG: type secretion protein [Nevskia sp.]|nr:type secretion protein [Nevskia sp.]
MSALIDAGWVITVALIAGRLAGVFLLVPVLGFSVLPPMVRVMFVLLLALALASAPGIGPYRGDVSSIGLTLAMGMEFLLGAALAFGLHAAMAAFSFGGQLLDFQVGFSAAALFDPNTQVQSPLMSVTLGLLGSVAFLTLDAHHELIRGLVLSFQQMPPGHAALPTDVGPLIAQFGLVFVYGLVLVSPAILGLMLVDIAVAVTARTMPQINVYFIALPLKVFVGLLLLAISLAHLGPLLRRIMASIFSYWQTL